MENQLIFELILLVILLIIARITFVIYKTTTGLSSYASKRNTPCISLICIGSGGHTTEMLELIQKLEFNKYTPRYYVMSKDDNISGPKVEKFEKLKISAINDRYYIIRIPRSKSVGQSYFSSVFTTIISVCYSVPMVLKIKPEIILCNGPGTSIPICVISFLLKCAFISNTKIVFIESFCRTKTFSLSGKILTYLADNLIVQWPSLKSKVKRAEYIGQLM